jgi:hypothetical protein
MVVTITLVIAIVAMFAILAAATVKIANRD